jgi:hypothetical protein
MVLWTSYIYMCDIRDRPFNLKGGYGFLFRSELFFRTTQDLEFFVLSRKTRIFFPECNIRLYDKNSESDYFFFPPPKSEYFFQQHWESEYFFRKKTLTLPPFQVKWSFPYNMYMKLCNFCACIIHLPRSYKFIVAKLTLPLYDCITKQIIWPPHHCRHVVSQRSFCLIIPYFVL